MSDIESTAASNMSSMSSARAFVKEWLSARQLSAAQLSRISGLKQYTISRFLNGKVDEVELETATSLYRAMQKSLTEAERLQLLQWLGLGNLLAALQSSGDDIRAENAASDGPDRDAARAMIEAWMREHGHSQAELARRAEVDASRIGRFLRGKIEAKTAARIYRAVHDSFDAEQRRTLLRALGLHDMAATVAQSLRSGEEAGGLQGSEQADHAPAKN